MAYTVKYDSRTVHIAGIATANGNPVCSALESSRSFRTGHTFGDIQDAINAVGQTRRWFCRTCQVGANLIITRKSNKGDAMSAKPYTTCPYALRFGDDTMMID